MLYLAIDQRRKQLTVNIRNENGDILLKRKVSIQWQRVPAPTLRNGGTETIAPRGPAGRVRIAEPVCFQKRYDRPPKKKRGTGGLFFGVSARAHCTPAMPFAAFPRRRG